MKILENFHSALLVNDGEAIFSALKLHPRLTPAQQFAIYADGYRIRLLAAVRSDYPALLEYVGAKNFDRLACQYIEKNPPTNYNLDFYPHEFAEFLCENYDDIFACDLARLEGAIAKVFMLPDSSPFLPEEMAKKSPEEFGEMVFPLRIASRLVRFSANVNEFLNAQRGDNSSHKPQATSQYLLIYRHNNEVQRLQLSEAAFALLSQLAAGKNVANALDDAIAQCPEFAEEIARNLQSWFAGWVGGGVFQQN